jgi:hypothetical protein
MDNDIVDNMIETTDEIDIENQDGGYDQVMDDMIQKYKKTLIDIKHTLYNNFIDYINIHKYNTISIMDEWCILLMKWYGILKKGSEFDTDELYIIDINKELIDKEILLLLDKLKQIYNKIEPEYYIELEDFLVRVFKTYPYGLNQRSLSA